jgi:hypothetical protein
MEHWRLLHETTRVSQLLRLARAARIQAESAAQTKGANDRRQDEELNRLLRQPPLAASVDDRETGGQWLSTSSQIAG